MQEPNMIGKISQRLRDGLDHGSSWMQERKGPLDVVTEKTLKLNGISHDSAARLVRQQADFVEGTVDGMATRLTAAATAESFRGLIDSQIKLMPESRDRVVTDVRKTFEILGDTRTDLVQLFRETLDDLRGRDFAEKVGDAAEDAAEKVTTAASKLDEKVEEATAH
ncbi:MAG: phasin family protein [Gammaproteobacteria bacterium]|nr:phasin family protein [Gammaproteobacteria bacterium]NNF59857.1 hypothetical protein [Gammaproteobacteria bacterium]NNM21269.1 hypothetical protein [Gammaproteobacteria bacterium]